MIIARRKYQVVSGLTTVTDQYTPANDEVIVITEFGGNAAFKPETTVHIIWDYGGGSAETLFITHGDNIQFPKGLSITGNGSKKIAIVLENDQLGSDEMGGYWVGST